MRISFYFDPICPWCWVTARWLMDVREHRSLEIDWRPFSLAVKNQDLDQPERWLEVQREGHRALRVVEAARATDGLVAVENLYIEMGRRWHHDGEREFDLASIVAAAGVELSASSAADDPTWDPSIEEAMAKALMVIGEDIGVPAIVFEGDDPVGFYGPVISNVPRGDEGVRLFDHLVGLAHAPGFFELKRGRAIRPDPGARP